MDKVIAELDQNQIIDKVRLDIFHSGKFVIINSVYGYDRDKILKVIRPAVWSLNLLLVIGLFFLGAVAIYPFENQLLTYGLMVLVLVIYLVLSYFIHSLFKYDNLNKYVAYIGETNVGFKRFFKKNEPVKKEQAKSDKVKKNKVTYYETKSKKKDIRKK